MLLLDELAGHEAWLVLGVTTGEASVDVAAALELIRRARQRDPRVAASLERLLAIVDVPGSDRGGHEQDRALERAVLGGRISVQLRERRRPSVTHEPGDEQAVPLSDLAEESVETSAPDDAPAPETWFEVQLVDGWGRPLSDVEVEMLYEGNAERLTTDGDGRARLTGVHAYSATVWVHPSDPLRTALEAAWGEASEEPLLEDSAQVQAAHYRGDRVGPLVLGRESPKTLSIQPFVVLGRLTGMLFETNRSFLLPVSLASIAELRALYDRCAPCQLLVVGHTDTSGQADYNEALSLDRARSVLEYLRDDVDAWLERFTSDPPAGERWGAAEDLSMIQALPDFGTRPSGQDPVRWFQATRGLVEDGIAGPNTRRALVSEYMARDGTSLPSDVTAEAHGCGEAFPLDTSGEELDAAPLDGHGDPLDRRVELFFFGDDLGVQPPAPGPTSKAGSTAYTAWRRRAREVHERVFGPRSLEIVLHDEQGQPIPHLRYEVRLSVGSVIDGQLDADGFARIERLPEGTCRVDFPELRQGFVAQTTSALP
ncbi:MAG: OmpA family protein [Nannocystaceae bacterium]